ncbi:NIPSNAP family protein [Sinisalibacter lacisalsi]|uniref:NIPSNAP family protein n=1 Tax=Sinisalibacter lacisalsi TaxID=1526570 RepID=UPI001E62C294|nr:NIPSNAP family protein [Sinisalibacter lacisalsi]
MLFELRTYDLKPGKAPAYLDFFRTVGVGLVTRHLPMAGYWMVESGRLNRIEHLWVYADFAEREAARAALVKDRDWMEGFVPEAFADVVQQSNRFLALEASSPGFDAVVAERRTLHPNQPAASAMFAQGVHALTISANPVPGDRVAAFRVLSGEVPGARVTLSEGAFEALASSNDGVLTHELLRPLSLSPLR